MAFENLKPVRLAADADTPADLLPNVGVIVMVPADLAIPTTSQPSGPAGLPGYGRTAADGKAEWVMAGPQDDLLRHVNRLPAAGSWTVADSRRVWRRAAEQLRGWGAPSVELKPLLTNLYAAAAADIAAATPPV